MTKDGAPSKIIIATRDRAGSVEIVVSDTGVGIPKENMNRIWVPFFTTKSLETGTGLGLSISREIIERVGGKITVESPTIQTEQGPRGSRFVITLPGISESSVIEVPPEIPPPSSPGAGGSVLIVEDEVPLAQVLAQEVGRFHEVELAHGAEDALAFFAKRRFDVVLCDLRMPGMSGESLYSLIEKRDPDQARAFVFMSGVGFVPEVEAFLTSSGRPVLQKPFEPAHLIEVISEVVRAGRRAGQKVGPVRAVR
jgi:CheY-like chemotaxis protein